MGLRDDTYNISKSIELDEGFFETVNRDFVKGDTLKRGRGSERQTTVLVMIESEENPQNNNIHRPSKKAGYLKMKVIQNLKTDTINKKIEDNVEQDTKVHTDDSTSYKNMTPKVANIAQKVTKANVNTVLPWVHTAISNAKRLLLDVHHRIDDDFLQNYLNEFCYKYNRRYFGGKTMERLIVAGVSHQWNEF